MATVQPQVIVNPDRSAYAIWSGLHNGDVGAGVPMTRYLFKSAQVVGTFGAGGSISIEGSMDGGTTWGKIKDGGNTDLAITDSGIKAIISTGLNMRPNVTAGDGTTNVTVYIAGFLQ